jgi:hypothetical protein
MTAYRLYFLDALNHILGVEILNSDSDAEAIEAAGRLARRHSFELWDRGRMVARRVDGFGERSRPDPSTSLVPEAAEGREPGAAFGVTCLDIGDACPAE